MLQLKLIQDVGLCCMCGYHVATETHHIDWHHENDVPENRIRLCLFCHAWIHRNGFTTREEIDDHLKYAIMLREYIVENKA